MIEQEKGKVDEMEATRSASWMTLAEFAEYIGRTYETVYRWVKNGRLKPEVRPAGGKTFYRVTPEMAAEIKDKMERGAWF
jgi:excisionase family DNA binding protein